MQIRILKPGLLSTVQDFGRPLYRAQAVPVSGAMDALAARLANLAVGNSDTAAVIEFTYAGAEFEMMTDVLISYSGDGAALMCNQQLIPAGRPVFVPKGQRIRLTSNPAGSRTYLAVAGGWDVPVVLGSRSTYVTAALGGLDGRALQAGDVLSGGIELSVVTEKIRKALAGDKICYPNWSIAETKFLPVNRRIIRVVPAHETDWFTEDTVTRFFSQAYTLTLQSNRMGYQLQGELLERSVQQELLSTAVAPGTIQVTGQGNPVILMADGQTTGGYPRIGQVAAVDLPLCGQLKSGDVINFTEISRYEAEMLYLERERHLQQLQQAISLKF